MKKETKDRAKLAGGAGIAVGGGLLGDVITKKAEIT